MTICIAGICDNREKVLLVADRMITSEDVSVEFEHDEPKIQSLSKNCLVAKSGIIYDDITEPVVIMYKDKTSLISEIIQQLTDSYQHIRRKNIDEDFFFLRGLTMKGYYNIQSTFDATFITSVENFIQEYDAIDPNLLVVGHDKFGSHIINVFNPGTSISHTSLGFFSIGSGAPHAENSLIASNYSPKLPYKQALYAMYEAKKRAECAPGVGKNYTDIAVVDKGGYKIVSYDTIKTLSDIFDKREELIVKPSQEKINKRIKDMYIKYDSI